jgi:hypothetical protein
MDSMSLALGAALALSLAGAAGLSWWLARPFPSPRMRLAARLVLFPVFGMLFLQSLAATLSRPVDEGRWLCLVCGDQERQSRYADVLLHHVPVEEGDTAPFERWFARAVGGVHEHERIPVGCHTIGLGAVGCRMGGGCEVYFAALPLLPDPARAVAMAERVLRTPAGERLALLRAVDDEGGPFSDIVYGEPMDAESFGARFADWLELHPEWR